ncbi:unnamed protein product [Rotaria magnacalcarata]|uniref:RING-type domain-containing protein n=4 Tax=Rotaria magnacalcarata TaxID=392030 RepID=A0A816UKM4_9BILA|nr:unnamed protein product [Rotaria magnacalcarata]
MSRQYSNRPFIPSRRRVSHQMCDFVTYPASQTDDRPTDGSSWPIIDPLSCAHQPPTSSEPPSILTQNNLPYFQYPSHPHTLESPLVLPNQEVINNNNNNNNRIIHHSNESLPAYNFHYSQSNEREQTRPSLPSSLITTAATTASASASAPHYRLENPSAAAFTRHPPWLDDGSEDNSATIQRSTRNNNQTKRQRSSAASTPTSQSSQSYHHHERKRSRHEEVNDDSARTNHPLQENVSQPQSRSSDHHFQPYSNYRHVQPQPNPLPRTSYNDSVPSISRSFESRLQTTQQNRIDHPYEINNSNVLYGPHLPHTVQPSLPTPSRTIYHSSVHRPLLLETPPVALPRRQPIPIPRSSYTQQQNHHQRTGITIEPAPQRAPQFHRTSMPAHLHQRHSNSFLTDLLHHVIDAHAASYSDNHVHYHHHHHHHPPTASIDLIAYAWMSPGHDIFSLPAAFSIQFGDFFDLTIPDETPVVGLTDSELERLPTMIFTKSCTTIQDDDKCAVCLSEYIGGEKLKHLRCKHFFHSECIDPWLKTSTRCPICRGEQTS